MQFFIKQHQIVLWAPSLRAWQDQLPRSIPIAWWCYQHVSRWGLWLCSDFSDFFLLNSIMSHVQKALFFYCLNISLVKDTHTTKSCLCIYSRKKNVTKPTKKLFHRMGHDESIWNRWIQLYIMNLCRFVTCEKTKNTKLKYLFSFLFPFL